AQQSFEDAKVFQDSTFTNIVSMGKLNKLKDDTSQAIGGLTFTRAVSPTPVSLVTSGGLTTSTQLVNLLVNYDWTSLD
ncbi:hypothetical protein Q4519_22210, partial [Motilimonas sp. 1_MG-2023]|uniref:hypothetical protein n=1 Tax=Motilimonas sp. 1_MG-2023 TaxID=3062672 RepID=UPI0026E18FAF